MCTNENKVLVYKMSITVWTPQTVMLGMILAYMKGINALLYIVIFIVICTYSGHKYFVHQLFLTRIHLRILNSNAKPVIFVLVMLLAS